ncbi:MAG UNVERIFIED_CONTAM: helix-turn-helix domain-containing protein [Anaerolineae bacterium]|jgi:excisionase family DNA binding protein
MVQITSDETAQPIMLPNSISTLLTDMLTAISEGRGIVVMDEETELTTVQAADILKVSRPFLVGLLEKGEIPYRMVGSHRRVRLQDVLDYKENSLKRSRATLDELTAMAQEDGLYDL